MQKVPMTREDKLTAVSLFGLLSPVAAAVALTASTKEYPTRFGGTIKDWDVSQPWLGWTVGALFVFWMVAWICGSVATSKEDPTGATYPLGYALISLVLMVVCTVIGSFITGAMAIPHM